MIDFEVYLRSYASGIYPPDIDPEDVLKPQPDNAQELNAITARLDKLEQWAGGYRK